MNTTTKLVADIIEGSADSIETAYFGERDQRFRLNVIGGSD